MTLLPITYHKRPFLEKISVNSISSVSILNPAQTRGPGSLLDGGGNNVSFVLQGLGEELWCYFHFPAEEDEEGEIGLTRRVIGETEGREDGGLFSVLFCFKRIEMFHFASLSKLR